MGTGKTAVLLAILKLRKDKKQIRKSVLVLVPNSVNVVGWCEEISIFTNLKSCPLLGSTTERRDKIETEAADIFVLNYTGLVWMLKSITKVRRKPISYIDGDKVAALAKKLSMLVLDESQFAKTPDSLTTKACIALAQTCKFVYGLTGTPFSQPEDLWSQFYIIDNGETLGETLGLFRSAYYTESRNYWGGFDYSLRVGAKQKINERIQNKSIRYAVEECQDLPKKNSVVVHIPFGTEQGLAYKKLMKGVVSTAGTTAEITNTYIRLRQMASGFIDMKIEGKKVELVFPDNKKIEWLVDKLRALGPDRKVVVFHTFTKSGDLICNALKKAKIKCVRMRGKANAKITAYKAFKENKKTQVLVVNVATGGTGLNLQVASVSVFFEPVTGLITKSQAEKRTHRSGQTETCFQYDLIVKASIEQKAFDMMSEGKDLLDEIMSGDATF